MTPAPVTPVMITCEQRTADRAWTITQLEAHGVTNCHVTLSPCQPATPAGTIPAAHAALLHAREHGHPTHPILFLEDDLTLAESFRRDLLAATHQPAPAATYLYLNDTPARLYRHAPLDASAILNRHPIRPGLRRLPDQHMAFGTQAVLLTRDLLEPLIAATAPDAPRTGAAFDSILHRHLTTTPIPTFTFLPHPVQHRQARAGKGPGERHADRRSLSYGLPRLDT